MSNKILDKQGVTELVTDIANKIASKYSNKGHTHTKSEITDFPTSIPFEGGNADTLDGKHASDFAASVNPAIEGTIALLRSGNATTSGSLFAWENSVRIRNQDPNAEFNTYTDLLVTPAGVYIDQYQNGNNIKSIEKVLTESDIKLYIRGESLENMTSLNDCITPGSYCVSTVYTTDLPTNYSTWGILDVRKYGLGIFQIIYFTDSKNIIYRSKIIDQSEWSTWQRVNDGGNADTLDGKHASDFISMPISVASGTSAISDLSDGTYTGIWTDHPAVNGEDGQGTLIVNNYATNGTPSPWNHRVFISPHSGLVWHGMINNSNWYGWQLINDGGNADTVDGIHISCTNDAASQSHWFAAFTDPSNLHAIDASRAYVGNAGNSNTLGGFADAYHLGTLDAGGNGHGSNYQLYCQHNLYGDGRFGFRETSGSNQFRVDYATEAGKPYVTGTFTHNGSAVTVNLGFTPSIVIWGEGHRCYIEQGRTNSFVASAAGYSQIDFLSGGSNNFRHNMTNVPCYYIAFK